MVSVHGLLAAVVLAWATSNADAHSLRPEQLIAQLRDQALRETYGITEVRRHPDLSRLLVIRVDTRWFQLEPSRRRSAAEKWMSRWRHTVPQGIIAVLEDGTDRSLVNFDAQGKAALIDQESSSSPREHEP